MCVVESFHPVTGERVETLMHENCPICLAFDSNNEQEIIRLGFGSLLPYRCPQCSVVARLFKDRCSCNITDKGYCPQCDMVVELWDGMCACECNAHKFETHRQCEYCNALLDTNGTQCSTCDKSDIEYATDTQEHSRNNVCTECGKSYTDCNCPLPF